MTNSGKTEIGHLDEQIAVELELREKLIIKYIGEGMSREEAEMYALADLREQETPSDKP